MHTQLEIARLAFLETGKTPREAGSEKNLKALELVYRWGFSSPTLIDFYSSPNRRGVCSRLISQGYLNEHFTDSGGGIAGLPNKIITLSEKGLEFVCERTSLPLRPYKDRINFKKLRHDILVQRLTLLMQFQSKIDDYKTPAEIAQRSEKYVKEHDAIWLYPDGSKAGFELELSAKWDRDFDDFIGKCVVSWLAGHKIVIGTTSKAIKERYSKALDGGQSYRLWEKSVNGHWYVDGRAEIPHEFWCQFLEISL
jgi:hypothetical protein